MKKKNIEDFAVSSKSTGFDEFLKAYNKHYGRTYEGVLAYYGIETNEYQGNDIAWTTNIISPSEAITLLTSKPLTEGESRSDMVKAFENYIHTTPK